MEGDGRDVVVLCAAPIFPAGIDAERIVPDVENKAGNGDLRQSCPDGTEQQRIAPAVQKHAAPGTVCLHNVIALIVFARICADNVDFLQICIACEHNGLRFLKLLQTRRQSKNLNGIAFRSVPVDGGRTEYKRFRPALLELDLGEPAHVVERAVGNVRHSRGKHDPADIIAGCLAVECLRKNCGNAVRDRIRPRQRAGNKRKLRLLRYCIDIEQRAVRRGIIDRIVFIFRVIDIHSGKVVAVAERALVDLPDRIGDADAVKRADAAECVLGNGNDVFTVILRGDDQVGNASDLIAGGHGIPVAVLHELDRIRKSRVQGNIFIGKQPDGERIAELIGVARRIDIGRAVPAHKDLCSTFRRVVLRCNGQLVGLPISGLRRRLRARAVFAVIERDGVSAGRPVGIQDDVSVAREIRIIVESAVPRRAAGSIVPPVQRVTRSGCAGQRERIPYRDIRIRRNRFAAAAVERYGIGIHFQRDRLAVARAVVERDGDRVDSRAGKRDLQRSRAGRDRSCRAAVDAHAVGFGADDRAPRKNVVLVSERRGQRKIARVDGIAPRRGLAVRHRADADLIVVVRPSDIRTGKIVGSRISSRYCERLTADAHFISRCSRDRIPGDQHIPDCNGSGRRKRRLFIGQRGSSGAVVALGLRKYADLQCACGIFLEREAGTAAHVVLLSVDGDDIIGRPRNAVPYERFVRNGKTGHGAERTVIDERTRGRTCIAVRNRRHRKDDAALAHGTVGKVVTRGSAERKFGMRMIFIAALDGNIVCLRVFHPFEYKNGRSHDVKFRYARKCLIFIICAECFSAGSESHGDRIIPGRLVREIDRDRLIGRGAYILRDRIKAIRSLDGKRCRRRQPIPGNALRVGINAKRRRSGFIPDSEERRILGKNSVRRPTVRELLCVVVHTHPPTVKNISFTGRFGHAEKTPADRRHTVGRLTVIIQLEINDIFALPGNIRRPIGIKRKVRRDDSAVE